MTCDPARPRAAMLAVATLLAAAHAATPPPAAAAKTAPQDAPHAPGTAPYATHLPAGRFGKVTVYIPEGQPTSVALFLSGDGGWELGVVNMAHALAALRRGGDRRRHPPVLRQPAPCGAAPRRALPDDRRGLRGAQPPGAEGDRHERLPRAGAGRLLLRGHGRLRHAGAVAARHVRRRAQPRLLRRSGLRRRGAVSRGGAALHPEPAARAGARAGAQPAAAVDRLPGTEGPGVQCARRR